jgi:hypothetical protein
LSGGRIQTNTKARAQARREAATVFCEGGNRAIFTNTKKCRAVAGAGSTFSVSRSKNEVLSDMPAGEVLANVKA